MNGEVRHMRNLADLAIGAKAYVISVKGSGSIRGRILAMGLVPGTAVEMVRKAPLGDPIEISLKNYFLSLRASEALAVEVSSTPPVRQGAKRPVEVS